MGRAWLGFGDKLVSSWNELKLFEVGWSQISLRLNSAGLSLSVTMLG